MLNKSYRGFILWMIGFTLACLGVAFLPLGVDGGMLAMRLVCDVLAVGIVLLLLMIYVTEKVFWFSGISYKQAVEAGAERRKSYALKHLKLFGIFAGVQLIFSAFAQLLGITAWIDFALSMVGLLVCAIYSIRYKL